MCNYYLKSYKYFRETRAIFIYLKDDHEIDSELSSVTIKRQQDGLSVHDALLREAEVNLKAQVRK